MALVWQDPPVERRVFNRAVVAELRSNPGQWALIRSYPYRNGSASLLKHPADIEIKIAHVNAHRPGEYTELYARAKEA